MKKTIILTAGLVLLTLVVISGCFLLAGLNAVTIVTIQLNPGSCFEHPDLPS